MSIYDMIMITGMYTLSGHLYTVEDYQLKSIKDRIQHRIQQKRVV